MTQERRRPFVDVNPWRYERTGPGRLTPVQRDPDPRLEAALENPAKSVVVVRCGSPKGCGRLIGQVYKTSEGLLALAYERRPDPFALENRRLGLSRQEKVGEEVEAVPYWVAANDAVTFKCRHHRPGSIDADSIRSAAEKTMDWRNPETLWINRDVPE